MNRARLIEFASFRWFLAVRPVRRRDRIRPKGLMNLLNVTTSL